ncbi:MAG: hypothetical protein D4R63_09705 [Methylococcaceae bacterium]|nr:MAG: hypothetical protein D4R63_09705 [Methylococcaceae bacterium]
MERRNFIRLSVMGAGALGVAQHVLAQPTAAESLATLKNIYFTQQSPGRWKGKEATHLPVITVTPEGANCHVNVVTPHEMKGLEHYIVKHVLLDKNYEVLAEHIFNPLEDKIASSVFLINNYQGTLYALSMCNKHDLWLSSVNS